MPVIISNNPVMYALGLAGQRGLLIEVKRKVWKDTRSSYVQRSNLIRYDVRIGNDVHRLLREDFEFDLR